MQFSVTTSSVQDSGAGLRAVAVFQGSILPPQAAQLNAALDGVLARVLEVGELSGEMQTQLLLPALSQGESSVLLVGLGQQAEYGPTQARKACAVLAKAIVERPAQQVVIGLEDWLAADMSIAWLVHTMVAAIGDARYRFTAYKGKEEVKLPRLEQVTLAVSTAQQAAAEQACREAQAILVGAAYTRDLGNTPPNDLYPEALAQQARGLAEQYAALSVTVLDEADLDALGANAILAVGRGSERPPRLVALEYHGAAAEAAPIVFVGKGITFDTGGISLKPGEAMDEMKYDMCGAGTVLGVMKAVCELGLPLNVVGVLTSAENMPDGRASRPGDIIKTLSGQTVEILNTDAEGRLVLCDALTWVQRFKPQAVIDIATLTGACIVALGHQASAVLGNQPALVAALLAAGQESGDRAWELPLWEEYQEQLKSNFADMANIGGRPAGTITASCFLARFTKDYAWAHLDIAGVAWKSGKEKGATGRPVPLLMHYLLEQARA